ncbi:MAG: nuclear transport factor 2 family protein [Runella sp.]
MKKFCFSILLCVATLTLHAQTSDEAAVKRTIEQFFDGMRRADSSLVRSTLLEGAHLESIVKNPEGQVSVRTDSFEGFLKRVASAPAGELDERLSRIEVRHDGDLATAWTPYQFFYKGAFSHCGFNSFRLIRTPQGWKIWSVIDTRRKDNCE